MALVLLVQNAESAHPLKISAIFSDYLSGFSTLHTLVPIKQVLAKTHTKLRSKFRVHLHYVRRKKRKLESKLCKANGASWLVGNRDWTWEFKLYSTLLPQNNKRLTCGLKSSRQRKGSASFFSPFRKTIVIAVKNGSNRVPNARAVCLRSPPIEWADVAVCLDPRSPRTWNILQGNIKSSASWLCIHPKLLSRTRSKSNPAQHL
jgi:hypothetical protein